MKIEYVILSGLVKNEEYTRKVIPFVKSEYFTDLMERAVFQQIAEHIQKYNSRPTITVLGIELQNLSFSQKEMDALNGILKELDELECQEKLDWLLEHTEKFCKDQALHNAIFESIKIIDEKNTSPTKLSRNVLPDLLKGALSVSFDTNVGHDYIGELKKRFDFYHNKEDKIPFDINIMNQITNGGCGKKTLNIVAAACVHPDTPVQIRLKRRLPPQDRATT